MNRDKFDFDKSAKLGLNKKVQKKYQDKDSVSEISCVHSIDEAIKVFRNIVDHKLESCVQVEERGLFLERVPGKVVDYNVVGSQRIALVVREWNDRPGFTIHLAGPRMFSNKEKKTILKSPLLDSYVCNKKQIEIAGQGPLFQDPIDPLSFKVEVIEEIAKLFLSCIPKKYKREIVNESSQTSLGLSKKVQKIHDTRDAISEVDPLLDFNSFFNVIKDLLKNKIKEHEDTRINDLFEELSKHKYAADDKDMIEIKLKLGLDFDSERITDNLYFDEKSNFIKNVWSFASFLGAPYNWDLEEKFSPEFLTEKSTPLVKRGLILTASSASALADAIIEQALAYLDAYDEMTVSSSVQESVNLGLARKVVKRNEDRDSIDAVNDVELDEDEFMKIAEETFLKIPGIAVFDGPKINLYSDEKFKYASIFTENNLDSATRTTTKNGYNLGISCPIYLTIRKRQDRGGKGFYLYFLESTNTDETLSSTYQLFGVGNIGSSNTIVLGKYFKNKDSKYISDLTVDNIVKAADWLKDFIINAFPGEVNESALGLSSKVSNKFKSEHSVNKEIDEMYKMGIDEFENYFTEMCSSLSFPEFKELRIKTEKSQLGVFILKYASTTGSDKKTKRFNGKLEWCVDEDTGEVFFSFWIDNNLYGIEDGYVSMKFGTSNMSKKYVEKYFLPTYKNLKDCISFIEDFVNKNIKTIKKTFVDDTSLDESIGLGLSKKVQNKHEGHKEDAIENISILDPDHFFDEATDVIHKMLPDYTLSNSFNDKFYIDDPFGAGQGPFVKCRIANFFKGSTSPFALVIDLYNNKFVLWKYNFKVAPYRENKTSIKKKILSPEAKELNISELVDELNDLVGTIDESASGLGLASKVEKRHSEKDSVAALSELDEGAFLDLIADVVADEVGKLNDEVQKYPKLVKRNMSFKSCVFEKPIENGNVKVYCCYSRRDGSQGKRLASNLLILDLKYCYDRRPKFVAYVSGSPFKENPFMTVYYSESSTSHKTEDETARLIQNSLTITNVDGFGDFLYRETKARIEGGYF